MRNEEEDNCTHNLPFRDGHGLTNRIAIIDRLIKLALQSQRIMADKAQQAKVAEELRRLADIAKPARQSDGGTASGTAQTLAEFLFDQSARDAKLVAELNEYRARLARVIGRGLPDIC